MRKIKNALAELIKISAALGLSKEDVANAKEYLEYNELELCFDTITTQMHENDIKVENLYYVLIDKIAQNLQLHLESYL